MFFFARHFASELKCNNCESIRMIQASLLCVKLTLLTSPSNENNLLVICVDMQITLPRTFRSWASKLDSSAWPRWAAGFNEIAAPAAWLAITKLQINFSKTAQRHMLHALFGCSPWSSPLRISFQWCSTKNCKQNQLPISAPANNRSLLIVGRQERKEARY